MSRKSKIKLIQNNFGAVLGTAPISFCSRREIRSALTRFELNGLERISDEKRRRQSVAARVLLKSLLVKKYDLKFEDFEIRRMPTGALRIFIKNNRLKLSLQKSLKKISICLSHSKKSVVAGFSKNALGIDLESPRRLRSEKALRMRICKTEREFKSSWSTLELWVIKEAVFKASGRGLISNIEVMKKRARLDRKVFKWELKRFEDGSRLAVAKSCKRVTR